MSTLQFRKTKSCKTATFCQQNHIDILASLENNQVFNSITDFFLRFTKSSERKVSLHDQEENSNRFVSPDQSKIISLQDSATVYDVRPFVSPVASLPTLSSADGRQN